MFDDTGGFQSGSIPQAPHRESMVMKKIHGHVLKLVYLPSQSGPNIIHTLSNIEQVKTCLNIPPYV